MPSNKDRLYIALYARGWSCHHAWRRRHVSTPSEARHAMRPKKAKHLIDGRDSNLDIIGLCWSVPNRRLRTVEACVIIQKSASRVLEGQNDILKSEMFPDGDQHAAFPSDNRKGGEDGPTCVYLA